MKNLIKCLLLLFVLTGCSQQDNIKEAQMDSLEKIAKDYGGKIELRNSNVQIYSVQSLQEMRNLLKEMKADFNLPKIHQSKFSIKISDNEITRKCDSINNIFRLKGGNRLNNNQNDPRKSFAKDGEDPPYAYSISYNFDNRWPCPNVTLTVYYNVNSSGQITNATVTTTTYGYSFGSTYAQTGLVQSQIVNGVFVYQVTGGFTSTIGIPGTPYSFSNTNPVTYTGAFSIYTNNNGGGIDYVRQYPGQQNDQNTPMNE